MNEYDQWIQDTMYHMMMAKLNESGGAKHESGNTLFRVMRNNDIDLRGMHECGVESYDVPDEVRSIDSMFVTAR